MNQHQPLNDKVYSGSVRPDWSEDFTGSFAHRLRRESAQLSAKEWLRGCSARVVLPAPVVTSYL